MKLIFIQEIPSPYRVHLFNKIAELVEELEVWFLSKSQNHRPDFWVESLNEAKFDYTIYKDYGPILNGRRLHFNPKLIWDATREDRSILIYGGIWTNPTVFSLHFLLGKKAIPWLELNKNLIKEGITLKIKTWIIKRKKAIITPGQMGHDGLKKLDYNGKVIFLPNIIDEEKIIGPNELQFENKNFHHKIAVWPARNIPAKGIMEFLECVNKETLNGYEIRIYGQGFLRNDIERLIKKKKLDNNIRLIDYIPFEELIKEYKRASLFMLPSIHDPNPLSVIEALFAGLPILISKFCGNHVEAISQENGWLVDPRENNQDLYTRVFSTEPDKMKEMGAQSLSVAMTKFGSENVSSEFLSQLNELGFK